MSLFACLVTGALAAAGCTTGAESNTEDAPAATVAARPEGAQVAAPTGSDRTASPRKGASGPIADKLTDHLAFDVEMPRSWPAPVESVALYRAVRGAPPADVAAMQAMFEVRGTAESTNDFGGVAHVREDKRHLYVFNSGGVAYHDTALIGSTTEIAPLDEAALWQDASRRIAQLHLDGPGLPALVPGHASTARAATGIRRSMPTRDWPVAQSVNFELRIDGLPTFGAGNDIQFVYGDGGALVSFTSNARPLEKAGTLEIESAQEAVGRYLDRANRTGRWNLVKAYVRGVRRMVIDHAQLGYYLPNLAVPCETVEPVYAIGGTVDGVDGKGHPITVPLMWLEPAAPGRTLADINVSSTETE